MTDLVALQKELETLAKRLHKVEREINDDACRAVGDASVDIAYKGRAAMAVDAMIHAINMARIQIRVAYELPDEEED